MVMFYPMTNAIKTSASASGRISGAKSLDNGFFGSGGVKTPFEPKNPVHH
jgi:hypothetical protein